MDFVIKKEESCNSITIIGANLSEKEVVGVYTPIRKAIVKHYRLTPPALLTQPPRKDGTITVQLIGGNEVTKEVFETAISGLKKYLIEYAESNQSLRDFTKQIKENFGVDDFDIEQAVPTPAWFTKYSTGMPYLMAASH